MTLNRILLLIVLLLAAGAAYWRLTLPAATHLAMPYLGRQLSCVDKLDLRVGTMTVTSADDGNTLSVATESGSYTLNYTGGQESYRNGEGQTLAFGSEMSFSGFFGDKHGHCS